MAGRVVTDPSEWDELVTRSVGFASDLSPEHKDVTIVYKRINGEWTPWTMIAESAALRSIGQRGRGLYALTQLNPPRKTSIGYALVQMTCSSNNDD